MLSVSFVALNIISLDVSIVHGITTETRTTGKVIGGLRKELQDISAMN